MSRKIARILSIPIILGGCGAQGGGGLFDFSFTAADDESESGTGETGDTGAEPVSPDKTIFITEAATYSGECWTSPVSDANDNITLPLVNALPNDWGITYRTPPGFGGTGWDGLNRSTDWIDNGDTTTDPETGEPILQGMDGTYADASRVIVHSGHGWIDSMMFSANPPDPPGNECDLYISDDPVRLGIPTGRGGVGGQAALGMWITSCVGYNPELPEGVPTPVYNSFRTEHLSQILAFHDSPHLSTDRLKIYWDTLQNASESNAAWVDSMQDADVMLFTSPVVFTPRLGSGESEASHEDRHWATHWDFGLEKGNTPSNWSDIWFSMFDNGSGCG